MVEIVQDHLHMVAVDGAVLMLLQVLLVVECW